ncbi:hypothetical protein HPB47_012220 [Ixodes persulcatus]|uniref:Uncharacterized protein n=1 Tax=Ixodes persulcatus TaxID=34615 RepID=A0AC60NUA4_IXOPE|nr:hypothetical protein HPB47_012220 [Ixodes persulcatus]
MSCPDSHTAARALSGCTINGTTLLCPGFETVPEPGSACFDLPTAPPGHPLHVVCRWFPPL